MLNRFDIHMHTNFSDGLNTVKEMIAKSMRIGLKGIMISDHDTVQSFIFAKKILQKLKEKYNRPDFILIPGVEITTAEGDILAINVKKTFSGSVEEVIDKIHDAGGLASAAHPFGGYWPRAFADHFDDLKNKFDAIEVLNGGVSAEGNMLALKLAKKYNLPHTAGSDAHFVDNVGTAYTLANASTIEEFVKELKAGKTHVGTTLKDLMPIARKENEKS